MKIILLLGLVKIQNSSLLDIMKFKNVLYQEQNRKHEIALYLIFSLHKRKDENKYFQRENQVTNFRYLITNEYHIFKIKNDISRVR
jgi:hypothetical protein